MDPGGRHVEGAVRREGEAVGPGDPEILRDDLDGAPRLEEALREAEASDATSIVVDLGSLDFIDSTGLRLLVMAAERAEHGRFSMLRGPKQVHRVFEITDLVDRLPFAD